MSLGRFHRRSRRSRQAGYMLVAILFMVFLLTLALTKAAPRVAQQLQRDREEEMIHRGAQYARAVKRYYKKFGRYPTSIDQLKDTNHIRFLRKEYKDPMTKDGKWKVLHVGDVKLGNAATGLAPSAMGAGLNNAGMGQNTGLAQSTGFGQNTGLGQTGGLGRTTGLGQGTGFGQNTGLSSTPGTPGTTQTGSSLPTSQLGGTGGQTFGGGAIIGVASLSEKQGLKEFDNKSKYKEWYFVFDPMTDRGGLIQTPYTGKVFTGAGATGLTPSKGMPTSPGSLSTTPMQPSLGTPPQTPQQPQQPQ